MKKSNSLLSVVITTYNRYESLKEVIKKVYQQSYKEIEVIVSDDCSSDATCSIKRDFPQIKYVKTPKNLGYAKNSKFALNFANGEYIVFLSDDDSLIDDTFFQKAIELFELSKEIDLVFARLRVSCTHEEILTKYNFKKIYDTKEFIELIASLRFHFLDYFGFSSMIFKREYFLKILPFKSVFKDSCSVDISNIIKYLYITKKVAFLDKEVYVWQNSIDSSISGSSRKDLTIQVKKFLSGAIDIHDFVEDRDFIRPICNSYVKSFFDKILSDYENENKDFKALLNNIKYKKVYIYGRSFIGVELRAFLAKNGFEVISFIDDIKSSYFEDCISFDIFLKQKENSTVIIASYKYEIVYKIYKKLSKLDGIQILDIWGK